jgi:hypothetical protein
VANRETFARACERVCEQQGWQLLPEGVRVGLPGGRHQIVSLEFFEFEQEQLARLYSTIGRAEGLAPGRLALALQINARLAHGALAVRDGQLVILETLMLDEADAGEIEASVRYLAETADYYEKTLFGGDDH